MGSKEIKIPQSDSRERTPGTIADYRRKILEETDALPQWRSIDITQWIADDIANAKDDIADAVDQFVGIMEFTKEILDLYTTLVSYMASPLTAAVEATRKILKDLLALINLSDAGIYALFIPFKKGGTNYYVDTFAQSLSDSRDTMRPQMGENSYASALFLKTGMPELDFDGIWDGFKAMSSQFFGIVDRVEDLVPFRCLKIL